MAWAEGSPPSPPAAGGLVQVLQAEAAADDFLLDLGGAAEDTPNPGRTRVVCRSRVPQRVHRYLAIDYESDAVPSARYSDVEPFPSLQAGVVPGHQVLRYRPGWEDKHSIECAALRHSDVHGLKP
jgi:hypothetical protein